jgi:hypothetical protein
MGTENDKAGETRLKGKSLGGADQKQSVEHTAYEKQRNTDTVIRLDDETDTLYDDGLEVKVDSPPLTGADGVDDSN